MPQSYTPKYMTELTTNQDLILKMATVSGATVSGTATILLKVPSDRWVKSGELWFAGTSHKDDRVTVFITDEDNLLGAGAGTVIGGYTDTGVAEENRGHRINLKRGYSLAEAIFGIGKLPGLFYVKLIGVTGDSRSDTLCANVTWAVQE